MGGTMLPLDNRPWAKSLAKTVIGISIVAAVVGSYYLYDMDELHVSEVVGVLLLLLTIIPPNVAVVMKKSVTKASSSVASGALNSHLHTR
jgi:hypothetical protein